MAERFRQPQDGSSWAEAVIQSRSRLYDDTGWTDWSDIPAGPGTMKGERKRIKALRERNADGGRASEYRLVIRSCVVIDYNLADGTPGDQTTGG